MKKPFLKNRLVIIVLVVFVIAGSITAYYMTFARNPEYVFETTKTQKGSISNVVTATGTLEATNTVIVGTQVSGVIEKIYVDFNSTVKKGQLLATLDKSTLQFSFESADAEVDKANAEFIYQEVNFNRMKIVYDKGLLSNSDYDLAQYNYKKSEAALKSAKANLKKASQNVRYATIYSPIDGIVLNRAVEEGQTVAASMNTPELFTITNDLSTMQVEANVDEADIGLLQVEQRVEFTVDAFPDQLFDGKVTEIRLQPNASSNVITYRAIITVSNPDLKLKPGLTASITIYVEEANDVLVIAEKAIQFSPEKQLLNSYMSQFSTKQSEIANPKPHPENDTDGLQPPLVNSIQKDSLEKVVWVKNNEHIYPVKIETGIDDGTNTEVISGLTEGDIVVTSFKGTSNSVIKKSTQKNEDTKSPFIQEQKKGSGGGPPPR